MENLIYLAGLFDGEGSCGYFSVGKDQKRFTMEIKMTNESLIDWLVSNFHGTKTYRPSRNTKWKDQWRWRVTGKKAQALYELLKPHLKIK